MNRNSTLKHEHEPRNSTPNHEAQTLKQNFRRVPRACPKMSGRSTSSTLRRASCICIVCSGPHQVNRTNWITLTPTQPSNMKQKPSNIHLNHKPRSLNPQASTPTKRKAFNINPRRAPRACPKRSGRSTSSTLRRASCICTPRSPSRGCLSISRMALWGHARLQFPQLCKNWY